MTPLFTLGAFQVTPYGLCVLAGAICGVLLCLPKKKVLPVLPWTVLGAILLGHAFWVFFASPAYTDEIGTFGLMVQFWRGGYTLYGALLGGALGALLGAKLQKLRPLEVLDALTPGACAAICLGRLGEYFSGQGYGDVLENESLCFFPVAYVTYSDGDYQEWAYAVWFWEALAALILLAILLFWLRNRPEGRRTAVFVAFLGLTQILLEQLRTDDFVRLNPFVRFTQIAAALTLLALLIFLVLRYRPSALQIVLSFAAMAAGVVAVMMAEFVFDKPQMTWIMYASMIATALLIWALLTVTRKQEALLPSGFFAFITLGLILFQAAANTYEMNSLLLHAVMAAGLCAVGTVIAVNLPRPAKQGK